MASPKVIANPNGVGRQEAAAAANRSITVLRTAGPGLDHPMAPGYPEGAYLSNVLLQVL